MRAIARLSVIVGFLLLISAFMAHDARPQGDAPNSRRELREMQASFSTRSFETRQQLLPKVVAHVAPLTGQFDQIEDQHLAGAKQLADWIVKNYQPGKPLAVICVCTANSRRSFFTATMGHIAAAYYGFTDIRFYSGGTKASACNSRTITALRDIGVEVEATGKEASRGEPDTANPIYRFRWGQRDNAAMETLDFSKRYDDPHNPQRDFAALMVCSDADGACPVVKGAATRISLPYADPKQFDGTAEETRKYAERRDDIARTLLAAFLQARHQLDQNTPRSK